MRKITYLFLMCFLFSYHIHAQLFTVTQCNSGVASNTYGPMNSITTAGANNRQVSIYQSSQLTDVSGAILESIYFLRAASSGTLEGSPNFKIYLKETSLTDFGTSDLDWALEIASATLVYDSDPTVAVGNSDGWKEFVFSTNFPYSGTQNLAVFLEYSNPSSMTTSITWFYEYSSPCISTSNSNTTKYDRNTTGTLATMLASENYRRPHIGFDYVVPCPAPTNPQLVTVATNTADFSWSPEPNAMVGYQWSLMADGDDITSDTPLQSGNVGSAVTTVQVGSLTPGTAYDFYVRADCGATDGVSSWADQVDFQTNCISQLSGVYTIGSTGDYTTISDAVDELNTCGISAAVTFNIMTGSGPYNEQVTVNEITGASATNTITFNGNGETVTSVTDTDTRSLFLLDGADYVTINNFNFVTQDVDYNFVIQLTNGANFNTITNNTIDLTSAIDDTGSDNAGIVLSGSLTSATSDGDSGNVTITGNTIIGGYYGISISGQASGSSMNNVISDNIVQDFYYYGIYSNDVENTTISNNDLHRENRLDVGNFYALYFTGNGGGNVIDANKLHDSFTGEPAGTSTSYPIYHTSTDAPVGNPNIVSNNIIYNLNGAGGTNYAIYNSNSDGVHYYHNTILMDFPGATSGNTRGFYQTGTASDIEFKNNIISISRGGTGTKYCMYFNTAASTIVSDYNLLHMNAPAGTNHVGYSGGAQTTLIDWQTASSGDANSVDTDPSFAAPGVGQLNPTNSAVDNIGTPIASVTTDINGTTRSATTPDVGAFEFTPASCLQPNNIGANNITGFTADITWAENNIPPATTWEIEYGPMGYTQGTGQIANVVDNDGTLGETISGLTPLSDYDVYVRATCTGNSAWTGPFTFTTGCAAPMAGTYTIGATGDYTSIADAIADLNLCGISAAVTFNLITGSGPYNEQVTFVEVAGASATNTITFNGNGETVTSVTDSSNRNLFLLDGADYITINDFNLVTQDVDYNFVVHLTNGANFNTISNNTIDLSTAIDDTGSDNAGIVLSGSYTSATTDGDNGNVTITGNTIIGGYYGISISGSASGSSMNNTISDNLIQDFYYYGIYNNDVENTTISNNDLHRENRLNVGNFYALYFTGNGGGNVIDANKLHDAFTGEPTATSTAYPIYHTSTDAALGNPNIVSNNIIYNINGAGGTNYAIYNSGSDGVHYYHNTILLDFPGATSGNTRGFYQTTTASDIEFKNNIISITRGGTGSKYAVYFNTAGSTIASDNNVFFVNSSEGSTAIGYSGGDQSTLLDWQTASGGDANSVSVNPLFVDPTIDDYSPTNPSIDNMGVPVGILTDIDGNPRSATTPDVGAIEFVPASCVQPTDITLSNISFDSAEISWTENNLPPKMEWEIEYGLTGYTQGTGQIATVTDNDGTLGELLSGLTPSTTYDVYVRTVCSSTENSSWSYSSTFQTLCTPITAPFMDTVETHTATAISSVNESECWYTVQSAYDWQISDDDTTSTNTGPNQAQSGTNFFFTEASNGSTGDVAELYSPLINVSSLSYPILEFYYHMHGSTMGELHVDVYDGSAWVNDVMTPLIGEQQVNQGDAWLLQAVDLSAYSGTIQLRFRAIRGSNYYSDISIDDINLYDFSCAEPTNVSVSNITTSAADFNWTASADETIGYEYVVMLSGDDPDSDPSAASGTVGTGITTASVSTLSPGVAYDFYVRTICTFNGPWSTATFTTTTPPCDLPTNIQNTSVTLTTADFSWTVSADETDGYIWYVMADGEDPLVDLPVQDGTVGIGVTTLSVSSLSVFTDYDFYIQTDCGTFDSVMSTKVDFTTDNYPCTPPTSIAANSVTATTVKFAWPTNGLETGGYTWVLMADGVAPDVNTALFTGTTATGITSVIISGLTPNTNYDFYVQTNCATETSPWSSVVDITTLPPPCDAPTGLMTTTVAATTVDFNWTASAQEQNGYNWVVMNDGDHPSNDTPVDSGTTGTGVTMAQATGLMASTAYDFYVQTNCDTGNASDWSLGLDFMTMMPPCDDPTMLTLVNATTTTLDISWTASVTETDGYDWVLMADGDDPAADTPVDSGSVATGVTMVTVSGLSNFSDYDFYLQANCGSGNMSNWVMLDVSTVRTDAANFRGFEYYPNPVRTDLVMKANHTISQVVVYNLLGQQVIKASPNSMEAIVDFSSLQAGSYMVKVQINDAVKTIRIIKE